MKCASRSAISTAVTIAVATRIPPRATKSIAPPLRVREMAATPSLAPDRPETLPRTGYPPRRSR
jgi:hypothetical protein